ncbi:MAG: IS4/IS5 family transposase [Actinobacteria bacterium]|nr:MAG: IS4/IS5 family transposase [Actinomycetota bacterium]
MKNNIAVFKKNKPKVIAALKDGRIDFVDGTSWSFPDKFFSFLLSIGFFEFVEDTYTSPRMRKNIPLWILVGLMFQLKLSLKNSFYRLPGILKSGAVLTRTNFNIGRIEGGFNKRNKYPRGKGEIVNHDTLRKHFKDTDADELTSWNNTDVVKFFSKKRAILGKGTFVLDTSLVTLPDNTNYEKAEYLPLDSNKNYVNVDRLTEEEAKKFKYTLCYKMVNLLHISEAKDYFIFLGTKVAGGRAHDKPLGKKLVDDFVAAVGKGKIKKLIADRAFLDGPMISCFKTRYGIDMLIPLKSNMDAYLDAKGLARLESKPWKDVDKATSCYMAKKIKSYEGCKVDLNVILVKSKEKNGKVRLWSLATTRDYFDPAQAVRDYRLRWQIEERYKQIKASWLDKGFKSTDFNLVTAHIIFTLLVYSLIQVYLNIEKLNDLANKTMEALRYEESLGENATIMYAGGYYAALDNDEGLYYVAFLEGEPLKRFRKWIKKFINQKYRIPDDP